MAARLPRSVFTHLPKTGGTWVLQVLEDLGLLRERCHQHLNITEIRRDPALAGWRGLDAFAFVRHPVSWYQSYWAFKMQYGWLDHPDAVLDTECRSDDFNTFIRNCVDRHPGYLSSYYRRFLEGVRYVGRHEALRESLIWILDQLGEAFDRNLVYEAVPRNVSVPVLLTQARYETETLKLLMAAESDGLSAFGYGCAPTASERPMRKGTR